jgi:hypothetical protein
LVQNGRVIHPAIRVGDTIRLKDGMNVVIDAITGEGAAAVVEATYAGHEMGEVARKIQWVPHETCVPIQVLQPNGDVTEGHGDAGFAALEPGKIVQFERYGFVRLVRFDSDTGFCYFIND